MNINKLTSMTSILLTNCGKPCCRKIIITENVAMPCARNAPPSRNPLRISVIEYASVMDGTIKCKLVKGPPAQDTLR